MGDLVEAGLSVREAAQVLGVSAGTIRHWSEVGYLESFLTERGERRFSQDQIDQFIFMLERQQVDAPIDRRSGSPPPHLDTSPYEGHGGDAAG